MSKAQAQTSARAIIAAAKLITGWSIPTGQALEMLVELLASELQKEHIPLTVKEVDIAFRRHASKIKDYAKDFSLSLFNQVMDHYYGERNEAVKVEAEVYLKDVEQTVKSENEVKNQARATVEECFQDFKAGKFDPIKSNVSGSLFSTITGDSLADPEICDQFIAKGFAAFKSALIAEKTNLRQLEAGKDPKRSDEVGYKVRMNEIDTHLALLENTLNYTKRYALKYCFEWMAKKGPGSFYKKEAE